MTIRIDRRQFLMGSSALAALAATGRSWAQEENRLRMLFWGGQARADRTYAVTDLYAKANPGTVFDGEFMAFSDYWPKLGTQVAGGNAPDIIQMDYRYIVEYANRGAIAPLDEFVGKELDLSDFDQDQLEGGKVNGQLYGISLGANSVCLMLNQAAFEEAGVEMPGPATSYADLPAMAEEWNAKSKREGMRLMADGSGHEPALDNWLRSSGKGLYGADGMPLFNADDLVKWFQMWADLRAANVTVAPEDQALDANDAIENTMITLKKAATTYANSNQLIAFQAVNDDRLTMTNHPRATPGATGGHYRKPSMFWSLGGGTAKLADGAKFINFFITDPEGTKALGVERGIPCKASTRANIEPTLDDQSKIALNFVSNLGDLLGPLPPSPPAAAGEINEALKTAAQEVGFGQKSPEEAGPAFYQLVVETLERAKAKQG